jgi:hypothetical protein
VVTDDPSPKHASSWALRVIEAENLDEAIEIASGLFGTYSMSSIEVRLSWNLLARRVVIVCCGD